MAAEVVDVRTSLASEGMMICVAHELGFARKLADRLIFMDQDEIVEQGAGCGPRQSDQPADQDLPAPGSGPLAKVGHGVAPPLSRLARLRWSPPYRQVAPGPADPL
jgi:energy-coupling factor transporter ATP-binding protein EcfA2